MTVLTTMACVVTLEGIDRPSFADILETLQSIFQGIYGSDAYISPDSKDGQLLAAIAKAIDDVNAASVAIYNSFSPATALGAALSNNVRINGIQRAIATKGTATVRVTGVVGTVIPAGSIAADPSGARWVLPAITIPVAGFFDATATAELEGEYPADVGTITRIQTPTRGWQTITNLTAAVPGAPVETDAALRRRQSFSVALSAVSVLNSMSAAVLALPGVTEVKAYENPTNVTDANGIPAYNVALVVQGGDSLEIGDAIMRTKTPGIPTHGNTTVSVPDMYGAPINMKFSIPTPVDIEVEVTIKALTGYQSSYEDQIKQAIAGYINLLPSGKKVDLGRLYLPAQLYGAAGVAETYEVDAIEIAVSGDPLAAADVPIAYDEVAEVDVADINIVVV